VKTMPDRLRIGRWLPVVAVSLGLPLLLICQPKGKKNPFEPISNYILTDFKAEPSAVTGMNDSTTISVRLASLIGLSPQGKVVSFSLVPRNVGVLSAYKDSTDSNGIAQTTFKASVFSGQASVIAEYGELSDTLTIRIGSATGNMRVDPSAILADGISTTVVTAKVVGTDEQPVSGVAVTFGTEQGELSQVQVVTDSNGEASTVLTSVASTQDLYVKVWANAAAEQTVTARVNVSRTGSTAETEELVRILEADSTLNGAQGEVWESFPGIQSSGVSSASPGEGDISGSQESVPLLSDTLIVHFKGVTLTVEAGDDSLPADGSSETAVRVLLTETKAGEPIAGATFYLSADLGSLADDSLKTDSEGRAETRFLAGKSPGTVTVKAEYGRTLASQVQLKLVPVSAARIQLTANPRRILADGVSTSTLTATVTDGYQNPLPDGTVVQFAILEGGSGSIVSSATTVNGVATTTLTSGTARDTVLVRASVGAVSDTVEVIYKGLSLSLNAEPSILNADGEDKAKITALLRDDDANPVANRLVSFRSEMGTIKSPKETDENGLAVTYLVSDKCNGRTMVTAETGNLVSSVPVNFTGITLELTASPSNLIADNKSTSTIRAVLRDPAGKAIPNKLIRFSAEGATVYPESSYTNPAGEAQASLKSSSAGTKVVTAEGAGASGSVEVNFTGYTFLLSVEPQSITAGTDTATVTAVLYDSKLIPLEGVTVNFSATLGSIDKTGVTDNHGETAVGFFCSSAGSATITATAVIGDTLEVQSSVTIDIRSSPPKKITLTADPRVVQVNGGTSTLTAVVTDLNDNPVSNTTVSFRILSGPRGGESIDPAIATTSANGVATTVFSSGSVASSSVNDVDIQAFIPGLEIESDIVELTIAGAPKSITVGYSLPYIDNQDGTYSLPVAAIVSDISGNAVIDGTLVLFSTTPVVGAIISPVATVNGKATTRLTYPSSKAGTSCVINAESGGISASTANVVLPGASGVISEVELTTDHESILADGQEQARITALVKDPNGSPVGDVIVRFHANLGTIDGLVKTGTQYLATGAENKNWGKATAVLISKADTTVAGLTDEITATAGGVTSSPLTITYRGVSLVLLPDQSAISSEKASTTIRAFLKEKSSNIPITNATVYFGTDLGSIVGSAVTDQSGVAATVLTSQGVAGTATITAVYGSTIMQSTKVKFLEPNPYFAELSVDDNSILGDGLAGTTVRGLVKDSTAGESVPGATIYLNSNVGDVVSPVESDDSGYFTAAYTGLAVSRDTTAEIVAYPQGGTPDTLEVEIRGIEFTLDAPDTMVATGSASGTVDVWVKEKTSKIPISGVTVSFGAEKGSIGGEAVTDAQGHASTAFYLGVETGPIVITGYMGNTLVARDTITVLQPGDPAAISIGAGLLTDRKDNQDGTYSIPVTALVLDGDGNPVRDGLMIHFSLPNGEDWAIIQDSTTTRDGSATVTLTYQNSKSGSLITVRAKYSDSLETEAAISLP